MAVLSETERKLINAYWRAANYLTLGQIYLLENPLLKERLTADHVKKRLLGHLPRPQFHVRPSQSRNRQARSQYDLYRRTRARRPRGGREHLPGGDLQRDLPGS